MNTTPTKTTLYLNPSVRRALKKRIADTNQTMSEYADQAIANAIMEDLDDIQAIEIRRGEPTEPLQEFLLALKQDGLI